MDNCELTIDRIVAYMHARIPQRVQRVFKAYCIGRSFGDIGSMWNVDGLYGFYAEWLGAHPTLAVDISPMTDQYREYQRVLDSTMRFEQADITNKSDVERLPQSDVVFCSGVLYHLPDPMQGLYHLSLLTCDNLILVTHTIITQDNNKAYFYPCRGQKEKWLWPNPYPGIRHGIDTAEVRYGDFGPWWWALSESAVESMMRCLDFRMIEKDTELLPPGSCLRDQTAFSLFVFKR